MSASTPSQTLSCHADLELAEDALSGDREAAEIVLGMLQAPELNAALRGRGASASEASDLVYTIAWNQLAMEFLLYSALAMKNSRKREI